MSADLLRRAASLMREDAWKVRRPYGRDEKFALAVADWLTDFAEVMESVYVLPAQRDQALAVARAYLGSDQ